MLLSLLLLSLKAVLHTSPTICWLIWLPFAMLTWLDRFDIVWIYLWSSLFIIGCKTFLLFGCFSKHIFYPFYMFSLPSNCVELVRGLLLDINYKFYGCLEPMLLEVSWFPLLFDTIYFIFFSSFSCSFTLFSYLSIIFCIVFPITVLAASTLSSYIL